MKPIDKPGTLALELDLEHSQEKLSRALTYPELLSAALVTAGT